jgi:hypothetical protein
VVETRGDRTGVAVQERDTGGSPGSASEKQQEAMAASVITRLARLEERLEKLARFIGVNV